MIGTIKSSSIWTDGDLFSGVLTDGGLVNGTERGKGGLTIVECHLYLLPCSFYPVSVFHKR